MDHHRELINELRKALSHLDDAGYLETLPLLESIAFSRTASDLSRGQALRRALLLAIEALAPREGGRGEVVDARCHEVLYRYAVSKQSMLRIASDLMLSDRQVYRELHRGLEALASIIVRFGARSDTTRLTAVEQEPESAGLRLELERLSGGATSEVDLVELVRDVVVSMQPLSEDRDLPIELVTQEGSILVVTQRVMLRQALLNLLSYVLGTTTGKKVTVALSSNRCALLQLGFDGNEPNCQPEASQHSYTVAAEILNALGVSWSARMNVDGHCVVEVSMPLQRKETILIVDDSEDLTALFRRYLRNHPYVVYTANSLDHALQVTGTVKPDIVILDILMPDRDGWEVLQALRHSIVDHRVRVIVCSVINDPQLRVAMKADAFLNKPVTRLDLLQTIEDVLSKET